MLLGDLNAEPHEDAIRYLLEEMPTHSPFVDAWTLIHTQNDSSDNAGFTFPACQPVKRIDYILVRNSSSCSAADTEAGHILSGLGRVAAVIADVRVAGKRPTEDTGDLYLVLYSLTTLD